MIRSIILAIMMLPNIAIAQDSIFKSSEIECLKAKEACIKNNRINYHLENDVKEDKEYGCEDEYESCHLFILSHSHDGHAPYHNGEMLNFKPDVSNNQTIASGTIVQGNNAIGNLSSPPTCDDEAAKLHWVEAQCYYALKNREVK